MLCRQPRRQRRVARPSATATVCTESREKPRAAPLRILLPPAPWRGAGGRGAPVASQWWLEKQPTPVTTSHNAAKPSVPPGRRPGSLIQRLQRPNSPFSSYLPPRAARRQAQTCPVGQPRTARQPRRQRRVARPSGTATVCTENRENPRATPSRILLPRPPGGDVYKRQPWWSAAATWALKWRKT